MDHRRRGAVYVVILVPWSGRGGAHNRIPLFLCPVPAGAPTPGDDSIETLLDVEDLVLPNPSCFACRVTGDSMIGAGIESGDYVIVERAREPVPGCIVVCAVDGELTLKRLEKIDTRIYLYPENERYKPLEVTPEMNLKVWGVAIRTIKVLP